MVKKQKKIIALLALIAGFAMYVACFEPFGVAEFAYVFAVPCILAARLLFGSDIREVSSESEAVNASCAEKNCAELDRKETRKFWLKSCFALSYLSWIAILIWIRHVYPPSGYAALIFLPLIISSLYIFPWFAILPFALPKIDERWSARLSKLLALAGLWVLLEWVRTWLFSGFGWLLLGDSQWLRTASIQLAEYGGVWIVSFSLIFCNLAIAEYFYRFYKIHERKLRINRLGGEQGEAGKTISRFSPEFYIALILVFGSAWNYIAKLPSKANEIEGFRAGFVQTDFAGILKWKKELAQDNFRTILNLTSALSGARVDVALWPEAATPPNMPVIGYAPTKNWIESLSRETALPILMGNMAYFNESPEPYAQNCAFFVSPKNGLSKDFYAKQKLVPFGEYTPSWFSFLGKIVPVGNLKSGESEAPLQGEIAGKPYKVGAMVCYEDIFPSLGRRLVKNGADLLFVCTNDSWYGREGGAWQHASHSALQAAATRRVLLRASNNGLSAVFDQYGRMRPSFALKTAEGKVWDGSGESKPSPLTEIELRSESGALLDAETLKPVRPRPLLDENGSIYFRGAGYADVVFYKNFLGETLYVKWGDWFVGLCGVFAFIAIFARRKEMR